MALTHDDKGVIPRWRKELTRLCLSLDANFLWYSYIKFALRIANFKIVNLYKIDLDTGFHA